MGPQFTITIGIGTQEINIQGSSVLAEFHDNRRPTPKPAFVRGQEMVVHQAESLSDDPVFGLLEFLHDFRSRMFL